MVMWEQPLFQHPVWRGRQWTRCRKPSFWSCICCDELHDLRKVMQLTLLFFIICPKDGLSSLVVHWHCPPPRAPMCRAAAAGCWGDDFRFSETALNNTDMSLSSIMLILRTNLFPSRYHAGYWDTEMHQHKTQVQGPALVVLLVLPDCTWAGSCIPHVYNWCYYMITFSSS